MATDIVPNVTNFLTLDQAAAQLPTPKNIGSLSSRAQPLMRLISLGLLQGVQLGGDGGEWRIPVGNLNAYIGNGAPEWNNFPDVYSSWIDDRAESWRAGAAVQSVIGSYTLSTPTENLDGATIPVTLAAGARKILSSPVPAGIPGNGDPQSPYKTLGEQYCVCRLRDVSLRCSFDLMSSAGLAAVSPINYLYSGPDAMQLIFSTALQTIQRGGGIVWSRDAMVLTTPPSGTTYAVDVPFASLAKKIIRVSYILKDSVIFDAFAPTAARLKMLAF